VVFDVDGTLVDSQAHILAAMSRAFAAIDRPPPSRQDVLGIVGLSLPVAMARLCQDAPEDVPTLVDAYKSAFAALRQSVTASRCPRSIPARGTACPRCRPSPGRFWAWRRASPAGAWRI
jgi:phosphoglycolate phosphatase